MERAGLLEGFAPEDMVRVYSIIGGIPFYHCLVRGYSSVRDVVERLIVKPYAPIRDEKDLP